MLNLGSEHADRTSAIESSLTRRFEAARRSELCLEHLAGRFAEDMNPAPHVVLLGRRAQAGIFAKDFVQSRGFFDPSFSTRSPISFLHKDLLKRARRIELPTPAWETLQAAFCDL